MRVELHCHTYRSRDSLMLPRRILEICRRRGIDRVAITDHNTISGAVEAADLDPLRVIVGEEIMTSDGEILAFYVREEIPPGLSPVETIARLREQHAVISVSHPFDPTRPGSWSEAGLRAILESVDALEVFNARTWTAAANARAAAWAARAGLPGTVGSDAHAPSEIGQAVLLLPAFDGPDGLRTALLQGRAQARRSTPLVHLLSRAAVWRKRLGWRPPTPSR